MKKITYTITKNSYTNKPTFEEVTGYYYETNGLRFGINKSMQKYYVITELSTGMYFGRGKETIKACIEEIARMFQEIGQEKIDSQIAHVIETILNKQPLNNF